MARVPVLRRPALVAVYVYLLLRMAGVAFLWIVAGSQGRELGDLLGSSDAHWYVGIADQGYDTSIPVHDDGSLAPSNLAFFPLFPALIAVADIVLPGGSTAAAIAVAWLGGAAAATGIFAFGQQVRDERTGILLVALWAVVPHAVVQSMGYTETLFTAIAAWCLVHLLRRNWASAGLLAAVAGLTRPTAAALVLVVMLAALVAVVRREDGWRPWLAGLLAPLGLLGFIGWVGLRLDRIDGYTHVQNDAWHMSYDGGRAFVEQLHRLLVSQGPLAAYVTALVVLLSAALLVLLVVDRVPWTACLYCADILGLSALGADYLHAKARLLLPAFPLLLPVASSLARARRSTVVVVIATLSVISSAYGSYLLLAWDHSP